ncbi:16S rRNA (guanine(966)-N(2))-methyltransferase RsmD [Peptostreptococcus porci]|uniref:16S rRNA (guanine(966)-N(2))-methyltransferase RsmD n=1 Tax=Peptostreptococcus porci TaxID=2652282 RepID=UPI0023F19DD3|nr:16S rRNA (guanine(966)-N(2))-methyltransferase RsmD [Peptostreptococcus porci]MDD7183443.1 16S rRNA (guanine(966)-N(2))-methyltransferase RsmD [Peptostreptococcus porci]MDY5964487.1 16S rRNA (guanine(966)-N(2))-methyltransferase RsmD [Peptostreptococcus porci]
MRVISGSARGLKLIAPNNNEIRPTTDRVKESMFNMISEYIYDCEALDLFSGSGALGIECLSRGAKMVYFCDKSKDSIKITSDNIKKSKLEDKSVVIKDDYRAALKKMHLLKKKFDVIFVDPPYYKGLFDDVLRDIIEFELLDNDGIIVVEHDSEIELADLDCLSKYKEKKYGMVMLTVLKMEEKNE